MQYDVYLNPNQRSKHIYPYVIDIQADLLTSLPSRLMVPLKLVQSTTVAPKNLMPIFSVKGKQVQFVSYLATAVDKQLLKKKVSSLSYQANEMISAMDCDLSGV